MSWSNLPATDATDWMQVDFLRQFQYALIERSSTDGGSGKTFTRQFPRVVASADATEDVYGNTAEAEQRAYLGEGAEKSVVEFDGSVWGPPDWDPETDDHPRPDTVTAKGLVEAGDYVAGGGSSQGLIRQLQSIPFGNYVSPFGGLAAFDGVSSISTYTTATWRADAGLHADGFTRKFPRIVSGTAVTEDVYGNAAAVGQRAYLDADSPGASSTRAVVEYDGSAWVTADGDSPRPDTLEGHGNFQNGDYIGPWLFNEIQAGINVLVWNVTEAQLTANTIHRGSTGANQEDTCAASQAAALSNWTEYRFRLDKAHDFTTGAKGVDNAEDAMWGSQISTTGLSLTAGASADISRNESLFLSLGNPRGDVAEFDASHVGMSLTAPGYALAETKTGVSGSTSPTIEWDHVDSAPNPPSCPVWTGEAHTVGRGFVIRFQWIIIRQWDVTGGFEYV